MTNTELALKTSIFQKVLSLFSKRNEREIIKNHVESKKIKAFDERDLQELAKNLRLIAMSHFAVNAPITDFTMMGIMDMLQDYYADLSAEEVYSAFKACAAGEYMEGKDILKPYGQFSVQFIGQVLNAFSRRKLVLLKQVDSAKDKLFIAAPKNYVSNETVYNKLVDHINQHKSLPIYWLWEGAYLHALSIGKVKDVKDYDERQKELFKHLRQSLGV